MLSATAQFPESLPSWIITKSGQYLLGELPPDPRIHWTIDPVAMAVTAKRSSDGRNLGRADLRVAWPPGSRSYAATREFSMSVQEENELSISERQALQVAFDTIGNRLRKLEAKLSSFIAILFPRRENGEIDWPRSPLSACDPGYARASDGYVKLGGLPCRLKCAFCTRSLCDDPEQPPALFLYDQLYQAAREMGRGNGSSLLHIGGDEPLRHPDLPSLVALAGQRGFRIRLHTADMEGLDDARLDRLYDSGLRQMEIPVYGTTADVHDAIVGVDGHFEAMLRVFDRARLLGIEIQIHSVAMTLNARQIGTINDWAKEQGATPGGIIMPRDEGESRLPVRDLLVRFSDLAQSVRDNMLFSIPCLAVGKSVADKEGPRRARQLVGREGEAQAESFATEYADICEGCAAKNICSGLPVGYLDRFGNAELKPYNQYTPDSSAQLHRTSPPLIRLAENIKKRD